MKLAKLNLEQTIQRVSQMRKLGLSLREAHDRQYRLVGWLKRVEELRALPLDRCRAEISTADLNALRAVFREYWKNGDLAAITEVATKLPDTLVSRDDLLAAYIASARERIDEYKHSASREEAYKQTPYNEALEKEALKFARP